MDVVYLSNLAWSLVGAVVTYSLVGEASGSLLRSVVLPLGAFCGTFTLLFVVAHRRESLLLRYWLYKRCRMRNTRIGGTQG
jgi:hypothetical protein